MWEVDGVASVTDHFEDIYRRLGDCRIGLKKWSFIQFGRWKSLIS